MATIGRSAKITLAGFDHEHIDHNSTIEDQVVLVFRAVSHYATVNAWGPYTHMGVKGRAGNLVMKRLQQSLFPKADPLVFEKLNGLINQVLRKTDAAVCLRRSLAQGEVPLWFVADSMPPNITVVALSHAKRTEQGQPDSQMGRVVQTWAESKVTPEEAGENMQPGAVTVTHSEPTTTRQKRIDALAEIHKERLEEHNRFVERALEVITAYQPVSASDVREILHGLGVTYDTTTTRSALIELEAAGKIVKRKEEDPERLLRGGGSMPKGMRVFLYGTAPGPVPLRTSLPDGARVYKPAAEHAKEKREQLDKICDAVLEVLSAQYKKGENAPRSVGTIAEAAALSLTETRTALAALVKIGLIYEDAKHRYFLSERRHTKRRQPATVEPPQEATTAVVAANPTVPVAPADQDVLVAEIHRAVEALAQRAHGTPGEIETLREQNATLLSENERLISAVASLKAALAALS